jgi:hypothetical protein
LLACPGKRVGEVDELVGYNMHPQALAPYAPLNRQKIGGEHCATLPLMEIRPHDQIVDAGSVFDGNKGDALGRAKPIDIIFAESVNASAPVECLGSTGS